MDDIKLFSSKTYHNINGGNISFYSDRFKMHLGGHKLVIKIDRKVSNILTVFDSSMTSDEEEKFLFRYISGLCYYRIR